jgi:DNA-binding transcriptional LysR family regulator
MKKKLNLDDLRAFSEAARTGTLSGAGAELQVPASTVGRSIQRLEQYTGLALVRRNQQGLTLTDAGKEYLVTCNRALQSLRAGDNILDGHRNQPTGTLRILCPTIFARDVLAPVLSHFIKHQPQLKLDIEQYASQYNQEPKNDIDIFFKVLSPRDSTKRVHRFPAQFRGIYASASYAERIGLPQVPEDLVSHRCVGSGPEGGANWMLTKNGRTVVQRVEFAVRTTEPEIDLRLALAGEAVAVLPTWLAMRSGFQDVLVPVLSSWKLPPVELSALYFGSSKQTPKVKLFLDFLSEYVCTERDPRLFGLPASTCFAVQTIPTGRARGGKAVPSAK